jgi:hypothetical protein
MTQAPLGLVPQCSTLIYTVKVINLNYISNANYKFLYCYWYVRHNNIGGINLHFTQSRFTTANIISANRKYVFNLQN